MSRGRVLFITSNLPRWAGDSTTPFVLHLAQDLQEMGWEICILAPHAPRARRREILGGVQVERFRYLWPASRETLCYQGGALLNLKRDRWNLLKVPIFVFCELAAAMRLLLRSKADIVHSHWVLPQGFVAALSARAAGVPHVATAHGSDVFALRGSLMRRFKRFALLRADAVTVNSSATMAAVRVIAPGLQRIALIPMGAGVHELPDPEAVRTVRARYRRGDGPLLIFVGRLAEEKGVCDLISAVAALSERLPDVTALILGDGPERQSLEDLARELGMTDRVAFIGWTQQSDIPIYLHGADIFVGPSRCTAEGRREAQGLTFAEAMLAGIPVIAGEVGGVTDLVRAGSTGLLVRPGSVSDIVECVVRIHADPELAEGLRRGASELVRRSYTREASARAFSALYEETLAR